MPFSMMLGSHYVVKSLSFVFSTFNVYIFILGLHHGGLMNGYIVSTGVVYSGKLLTIYSRLLSYIMSSCRFAMTVCSHSLTG